MKLSFQLFFLFFFFLIFWNKLKSESKYNDEVNKTNDGISEEEKEEVYLEFAEYDLNRDGLIDAEEITLVLKNMKKSDFVNFFIKVDLDSSGTISFDEYMIFIESN
ncbi:centrin, putative [Plasmodium gallinaceum]|uniref:Centrin, putative n=1 Tax=Plasmodium gallinaceum TaxID=5849 RepID=A0A1J1H3D1_PLAGA|nr:centrin, putative [Plasmodium gallinaceum]CRG97999.1 centrin, putative [Plasmodium gallinaceum]